MARKEAPKRLRYEQEELAQSKQASRRKHAHNSARSTSPLVLSPNVSVEVHPSSISSPQRSNMSTKDLLEDAEAVERTGRAMQKNFDDRVPDIRRLKAKNDDCASTSQCPSPAESLRVSRHFTLATDSARLVFQKKPWLEEMGFRDKHRALITIGTEDIERIHDLVYMHGARCAMSFDVFSEEMPWNKNAGMESVSFFAAKRTELDERGWTLLTEFTNDCALPLYWRQSAAGSCDHSLTEFLDHWESTFPGEQAMMRDFASDKRANLDWYPICNLASDTDAVMNRAGRSRFSTTNHGMTWSLEADPERHTIAELQSLLDVRLGVIAAAFRLKYDTFHKMAHCSKLHFPNSGGRVLITGKDAPKQVPHQDFSDDSMSKPSYFMIVTGRKPAPIWICDRSHHLMSYAPAEQKELSKIFKMRKRTVPEASVLICRGDIVHAGAAGSDSVHKHCARYHMYFVRNGVQLQDAIHLPGSFVPSVHPNDEEQ